MNDESNTDILIRGRMCVIASNTTEVSKVDLETCSLDANTIAFKWLELAETVSPSVLLYLFLLHLFLHFNCDRNFVTVNYVDSLQKIFVKLKYIAGYASGPHTT